MTARAISSALMAAYRKGLNGGVMLNHEAAAIAADLAHAAWQPIETAPKDGTHILAFGEDTYAVVSWRYGDWRDMGDVGWGGMDGEDPPDCWMPLPKPPKLVEGLR